MKILKNRTVLGIICISIAFFICFIIAPFLNKKSIESVITVRAIKNIKAGDEIKKEDIKEVEVSKLNLPTSTIYSKEQVIGKFAIVDINVDDMLLTNKISNEPILENDYLYKLNGEKRAISVTIKSFANGLSGKIKSGDIVSVISADYKESGETVIPNELKYVEVIAVTASSGYDANIEDKNKKEDKELASTMTLLVNEEQSKILGELEEEGNIHISLVYRGEEKDKFLAVQDEYLKGIKDGNVVEFKDFKLDENQNQENIDDKTNIENTGKIDIESTSENKLIKDNLESTKAIETTTKGEESN